MVRLGLDCTGCSACISACPAKCLKMDADTAGFFYPTLTDPSHCLRCNICEDVCPVLSDPTEQENIPEAYAVYAKDSELRKDSSSGGVFSLIARAVLNDGGAVFGASYEQAYRVQHICIEDQRQLYKLRGAKYAQSNLDGCFTDVLQRLKRGQKVLFSGTPCQVAGLKSFLQKPYSELFTVDFVCHGVPSPAVWEKYVKYRAMEDNNGTLPQKINLRSKSSGWSKYSYSNEYYYGAGKTYSNISGNDLFMRLFGGDYISRESCTNCRFKGYQRCSDITLGDFWGIWDVMPDMDDNKGTSVILLHSSAASDMMERLADEIVIKKVTLEQASAQNPSMLTSSPASKMRAEVIQKCLAGQFKCVGEHLESKKDRHQKNFMEFIQRVYRKGKRLIFRSK